MDGFRQHSGIEWYNLYYSVDGGLTFEHWISTDASSATFDKIDDYVDYVFKMIPVDAVGNVGAETVVSASIDDSSQDRPVAPSSFRLNDYNAQSGSFTASWDGGSEDGAEILIEASTDGGATWTPVAQTGANAGSATISGAGLDGSYTLRVSAFNDAGASDYVYAQVWNLADFDAYQAFALTSPTEGTVVLNGVNADGSIMDSGVLLFG